MHACHTRIKLGCDYFTQLRNGPCCGSAEAMPGATNIGATNIGGCKILDIIEAVLDNRDARVACHTWRENKPSSVSDASAHSAPSTTSSCMSDKACARNKVEILTSRYKLSPHQHVLLGLELKPPGMTTNESARQPGESARQPGPNIRVHGML
jgi:hypothetical protein